MARNAGWATAGRSGRGPQLGGGRIRPVQTIWVARLSISTATAQKITSLHHVSSDEVRDAIVCKRGLAATGDHHPDRGFRWYLFPTIRDAECMVVLYPSPVDPQGFALGSAYFT